MTNENHGAVEAFAAGALTAGVLLIEHLAFWPWAKHLQLTDELAPLAAYTLGTATIGIGLTSLAFARPLQPTDFWIVAGCGGAVIAGARVWRFVLNQDRAAAVRRGRASGHVAGGRTALEAYQRFGAGN